jgi:polysaccharide export outer membrane protein
MTLVSTFLTVAALLSCSAGLSAQEPSPTPPKPAATGSLSAGPATTTAALPVAADAPPQAAVQMPAVVPADVGPDYILGTDDAISVNVWKELGISGPLIIRPDGKISLPLVGDLPAAGLTPMKLAASIADHLKQFINDPTVTVTVTATNSRRIFFIGEVQHAGPMAFTRELTMLQAISAAGGLTPYAAKNRIYILRGSSAQQKKIPFKYDRALKTGDMQGVVLAPGDTVVVP